MPSRRFARNNVARLIPFARAACMIAVDATSPVGEKLAQEDVGVTPLGSVVAPGRREQAIRVDAGHGLGEPVQDAARNAKASAGGGATRLFLTVAMMRLVSSAGSLPTARTTRAAATNAMEPSAR